MKYGIMTTNCSILSQTTSLSDYDFEHRPG
jgi:hypothetical protein